MSEQKTKIATKTVTAKTTGRNNKTADKKNKDTVVNTAGNKAAPKRKMGRPKVYGDEVYELIFERIAKGESVVKICDEKGMPNRDTFYTVIGQSKDLSDKYARAREHQADFLFEEMRTIADEPCVTVETDEYGEVEVKFDHALVAHKKLQIDTRKWQLSKMFPKKYGERVEVEGNVNVGEGILAQLAEIGLRAAQEQEKMLEVIAQRREQAQE